MKALMTCNLANSPYGHQQHTKRLKSASCRACNFFGSKIYLSGLLCELHVTTLMEGEMTYLARKVFT